MILLNDVIEIFGLADDDSRPVLFVVTLDRCFVGRTPIDGDRLGDPAMSANRLDQELFGGLLVALLGEQKVNRLAVFVNGAVQIIPCTLVG